jgi:hypothetical protein
MLFMKNVAPGLNKHEAKAVFDLLDGNRSNSINRN